MGGAAEVAEAHHCEILGHPQATAGRFGEHALGDRIGAAHNHLRPMALIEQLPQTGSAHFQGGGWGEDLRGYIVQPVLGQFGDQAVATAQATGVADADHRVTAITFVQQMAGDSFADCLVGKAHQHVQRCFTQVPGLDHRNARVHQALAADFGVQRTRQNDAIRAAAEQGFDELFFLLVGVAGEA